MARLRSDLWVAVFVRRHNDIGNMCVVSRRGDPIAGQVLIAVDHLNGTQSLYMPAPMAQLDSDNAGLVFQRRLERAEPQKVRERITREADFDPDLWVIDIDLRGDDLGIDLVR